MAVRTDPRELVRNLILSDYRPVEDSIEIIREKRAGKEAALAVAFEDRAGVQRRGMVGLCKRHNAWEQCGGFMGSTRVTGDRDV